MTGVYILKIIRWSIIIAFAVIAGMAVSEISTAMLVSGGWI